MSFNDFLKWEETNINRLMSFKNAFGVHLWPLVRVRLAMIYIQTVYKHSDPHSKSENIGIRQKLLWAMRVVFRSIFFMPSSAILIFSTSVVNMKEGSGYVNRLYDEMKKTLGTDINICERSYRKVFRVPRRSVSFASDSFFILPIIISRFLKQDLADFRVNSEFVEYLKSSTIFNVVSDQLDGILDLLNSLSKQYRVYRYLVPALVKAKRIKAVVLEDASYGAANALLMKLFLRCGVMTIEHQHGLVAKNHPAYNYPCDVVGRRNQYYKYLPQYYMVFGEYWSRRIETPSNKIIWGFPYLSKKADVAKSTMKNIILIVSDGIDPQLVLGICKRLLLNDIKGRRIVLKLHPGEVPLMQERYGELLTYKNIEIKTYESVYDLLAETEYVVGVISTVMIEAFAFGLKPYVYKTEYSSEIFEGVEFNYFESIKELDKIFTEKNNMLREDIDLTYYWAVNSQARYKEFFIEKGVLNK